MSLLSPLLTGIMVWNVDANNNKDCTGTSYPYPWDNECVETQHSDDGDDDCKSSFLHTRHLTFPHIASFCYSSHHLQPQVHPAPSLRVHDALPHLYGLLRE
jgi:hypothetical protein